MNTDEVKRYCNNFPCSNKIEQGEPSNILAYKVADKKFAYFKTSAPEKWRFSIRVLPERFLELTDQEGIKPARYMHRFHWVTIVKVNSVPSTYLKELITWSYDKALSKLTHKQRSNLGI